jgi:hypothetical protein
MRRMIWLVLLCGLIGCEDKPPARTVFDPQVKALDKARAVEGQARQAGERRAEEAEAVSPTSSGY